MHRPGIGPLGAVAVLYDGVFVGSVGCGVGNCRGGVVEITILIVK